jgi:hypothetical protein
VNKVMEVGTSPRCNQPSLLKRFFKTNFTPHLCGGGCLRRQSKVWRTDGVNCLHSRLMAATLLRDLCFSTLCILHPGCNLLRCAGAADFGIDKHALSPAELKITGDAHERE